MMLYLRDAQVSSVVTIDETTTRIYLVSGIHFDVNFSWESVMDSIAINALKIKPEPKHHDILGFGS